jgi:hypothetical protein
MDDTGSGEPRSLAAVAEHREAMLQLARRLRRRAEVVEATSGIDIRAYRTPGTILESWVEAEMRDGRVVCWWLELRRERDRWLIEASVLRNDDAGQDTVRAVADRSASTLAAFVEGLRSATAELTGPASEADLQA